MSNLIPIAFILGKSGNVNFSIYHAIEPLFLNSAVVAGWLPSTRAQHSVPCCLKRVFLPKHLSLFIVNYISSFISA